jgi:hypothetical protein
VLSELQTVHSGSIRLASTNIINGLR